MKKTLLGILGPFCFPHACFLTQVSLISVGQGWEIGPSIISFFSLLLSPEKLVNYQDIDWTTNK